MGISDRLRRLDDGAEKAARRLGLAPSGDDATTGKPRRGPVLAAVLVGLVVGVARIAGGDPLLPTLIGMALLVAVAGLNLGRAGQTEEARKARGKRQLRVASVGLLLFAVYLAAERAWAVAALLSFLVAFFNVGLWAIERYERSHQR